MVMSYAAHRRDFGPFADEARSKIETPPKRAGIFRRVLGAFIESRQRAVDRQIARLLVARSATTLTDDLEREISRRLSMSNWTMNANPYVERRFP
jgi:hypothetical protein